RHPDRREQAALDIYSFVRGAYTQPRRARLRGTSDNNAPLPNYDDQGNTGASAPAAGAPAGGLANYSDPGGVGEAPVGASRGGGAGKSAPNDLPNYTDPGDTANSSNTSSGAPASASPATEA